MTHLLGIPDDRQNWTALEESNEYLFLVRDDAPHALLVMQTINGWHLQLIEFTEPDVPHSALPVVFAPMMVRTEVSPQAVAQYVDEMQATSETVNPPDRG